MGLTAEGQNRPHCYLPLTGAQNRQRRRDGEDGYFAIVRTKVICNITNGERRHFGPAGNVFRPS